MTDVADDRPRVDALEVWAAWNEQDLVVRVAQRLDRAGDAEGAARLRASIADRSVVAPMAALAAQQAAGEQLDEVSRANRWRAVQAAREVGHSWTDIGEADGSEPAFARLRYPADVELNERHGSFPDQTSADLACWAAGHDPAGATAPADDTADDTVDGEPIPFPLTSHGYGALRPDIAPVDEYGLSGGEGPVLSSGPTLSAADAAQALARDGRSLDEARAAVRSYQDATAERLGTPVHSWGLDDADLDTIRAETALGPPPVTPTVAPAIPLPRAGADPVARSGRDAGEDARREQLTLWHTADTTAADVVDAGPARDRGAGT